MTDIDDRPVVEDHGDDWPDPDPGLLPAVREPARPPVRYEPERILPAQIRTVAAAREHARVVAKRTAVKTAKHAVRTPWYGALLTWSATKGAAIAVHGWFRWVTAAEWSDLPRDGRNHKSAMEALREANHLRVFRLQVTGAVLVVAAVAALVVALKWGQGALLTPAVVGLCVLGWVGRRREKTPPHADVPVQLDLGQELITQAFQQAGLIKSPDKHGEGGESLRFIGPVTRADTGTPAWVATVDMPSNTADAAIGKLVEIAGALGYDEQQIVLSRVRGKGAHARRVRIWAADDNPWDRDRVTFPLVREPEWSLWDGVPLGETAQGTPVTVQMLWSNYVIGASPRKGKTFALMLLTAAVTLDIKVRVIFADGKGGAAFKGLRSVPGVQYVRGSEPASVRQLADILEEEVPRMQGIYQRIFDDDEQFSEDKITRESDIELTFVGIDEAHFYLPDGPGDKDPDKLRIEKALDSLLRTGPAAGYMTVLATQRLVKDAIPSTLLALCDTRLAFRVANPSESYMVLGMKDAPAHLDASQLPGPGIGILAAAGDSTNLADTGPQRVMTYGIDVPTFRAICERGAGLRGRVEPEPDEEPPVMVLAALDAMTAAGVDRMTRAELTTALLAADPDRWDGLDDDFLRLGLEAHVGERVRWRDGEDRVRGYTREQLAQGVGPCLDR